ncbi:MAG: mutS2 2 [Planctomycetota bacterium]|nr:mutS2 2 [Planctomycetota bacterium]
MNIASRSPREEYTRRLVVAREVEAVQDRRDAAIANGRLVLVLLAIPLAWASVVAGWLSAWWLLIPAGGFLGLIRLHERAGRARDRAKKAIAVYERGLARVDDRWIGLGGDGSRFLDPTHPYSADLDLFGKGSLFQRLSTARTRKGEAVLASWLLAPADRATIALRQEAIAELRERLDLREDLARLGEGLGDVVDVEGLAAWCAERVPIPLGQARSAAAILAIGATVAVVGWLFFNFDGRAVLAVFVAEAAFALWLMKRCNRILERVSRRADELAMLAATLDRIEQESFASALLTRLRFALMADGQTASSRISALHRTVDRLEWRRNMFFAPSSLLWLWGTHVALAVEGWRRRWGRDVAGWVSAMAEFEAISSIAAYSFENPDDPFAEIADPAGTILEATALGHPLLPDSSCVRNDLRLGGEPCVLIVSGSNMSGKSTLLRSVGVNVVLGLAGAPVKAERLRISPVAIGATLRIQDSLQEGKSRFYAEILRLRQVVDLTGGPLPLMFLLDEILHGTNSHDRLEGASAIVRGLIDRGAIGLVTTHDLALAEVGETLTPRAANVHFEDHFEDGVMRFDYTMRPGVVKKSNALALMRAVGLDV